MLLAPDSSQAMVLDAPLAERRIVVAGPGAGKTTTSIMLIDEIVRKSGDLYDRTILFVSFSRSAMAAALGAFGDVLHDRPVNIAAMTLDSLAWQLVDESDTTAGEVPDFDGVVRRATEQLRSNYDGDLDDVVHLIVDEAQDLSAPRREMLCAVIDRIRPDAGVTIFGDPMQSIYEFLDGESERGISGWDTLVEELGRRSISKFYELAGDHRSRRRGPKSVAASSRELRTADSDTRESVLDDLLTGFTHWGIDEFAKRAADWRGSTAVLARTNTEVLQLFQELSMRGHRCVWRQPGRANQRVAPWVAHLWWANGGKAVSQSDFEKFAALWSEVDVAWFRIMLAEAGQGDLIDWSRMAQVCRAAVDPLAPWFADRSVGMLVATIHQAKGLEWDNVAVVGAHDLLTRVGLRQPECELLYVALSRARDKIVVVDEWRPSYMKSTRTSGVSYQPKSGSNLADAISVTPDCLVSDRMVGGSEGQEVLASLDEDALAEFELLASGHADWPTYRCSVAGSAVGVTTPQFGRALASLPGIRNGAWPQLGPVCIDGVESRWATVDGTSFWLKPRPFGMASIQRKV